MANSMPLLESSEERQPSGGGLEAVTPQKKKGAGGHKPLRDLTDLLKEQGTHQEYLRFREGYMRWRKGGSAGAKGEIDHAIERSKEFEHWYPTVGAFNFRRTISFWGGTMTIEGCLLFLWVAYFAEYGKEYTDLMYYLTKWPTLCGGTAFLAGIYMAYYELINMDVDLDADKRNLIWCDWQGILNLGIEIWSVFGAALYLLGALLYTVSQISDLFALTDEQAAQWVQWPLTIGGFFFFLAGVCELIINRVFLRLPVTYVWWASVFDFLGGVGFWVCACPNMLGDDEAAAVIGALGVLGYLVGAILSLSMWRGEQFGSAIIPALNVAVRDTSTDIVVRKDKKTGICHIIATPAMSDDSSLTEVLSPAISARGMLFITVYILIGVVQIVVVCAYMAQSSDFWLGGTKSRRLLCNFVSDICNVVMVHMILMLHSACVSLPKRNEQPYRALFIGMRILSVILVLNSFLNLEVIFESDVRHGGWQK